MAMTYLTKLKPEPMGAHNLSAAYGVNSLVMSEDGAAAYISVKDVPAGTPLTNTEYWKIHTDLTAVKQSAEAATQKANAARDEMLEIARNLTDMVEKSGNPVQAELVGGLPFDRVETMLAPIQSGSGDPSPNNIRTISGWTGANLTRRGKNLINLTFAQSGLVIVQNADGTITATNNTGGNLSGARCEFTGILPAGTYTISKNDTNADVFLQTSSEDYSNNITTYTFNYDGVSYLRVLCSNIQNGSSVTYKIQLEPGSTATAYEPYQGNTYTADFGQTVYGGTLDWQTGVLTVDKRYVVIDGVNIKCNGAYGTDSLKLPCIDGLVSNGDSDDLPMWCDTLMPVYSLSDVYNKANSIRVTNLRIPIHIDGIQGVGSGFAYQTSDDLIAAANTWLTAHHVSLCYTIVSPTTIQLTPQEIKQLQGVNTIYGDGSISMTGRADKALALEARIAALEAAG